MRRKLLTFDEMKDMAAADPEGFEAYRQEIIDGFIANLPRDKQARARKEQWRVDMITRKVKDPLVRMHIVYNEMLQSFIRLNSKLNHTTDADPPPREAKVLEFRIVKEPKEG